MDIYDKVMVKNIDIIDSRLIISYIASNLDRYNIVLSPRDTFIEEYCSKKLDEAKKLLEEGKIVEKDCWCYLSVKKPVMWNYILTKQ